jgi:3-oxoacyl-[acyl-carrier-protein] synthase II
VTAAIAGAEMLTCLGDTEATLRAIGEADVAPGPLRYFDPGRYRVRYGYQVEADDDEESYRPTDWVVRCVRAALRQAGIDAVRTRTVAIVGSGLRELRSVERWHADNAAISLSRLHFGLALRQAVPGLAEVLTISNACAASGYALGLGMDLLELGEAEAVVVAGCDAMTESMLAMIARLGEEVPDRVEPFDVGRTGVLLGEGAVAVVLRPLPDVPPQRRLGIVHGVGFNCDAHHETAPSLDGVAGSMRLAHERAGVKAADIGLVVAHGTGTPLNDPNEALALRQVFGAAPGPLVTAVKGATGHTSGGAALMNVLVALRAMTDRRVPPVAGLREPIAEARDLRLVIGGPAPTDTRLAQVNAFGFGGVNAVAVVGV